MRRHAHPIGDLLKRRSHSVLLPDLICQSFQACASRDFIVRSLASISQAPRQQHTLPWLTARPVLRSNTLPCGFHPSFKYSTSSNVANESTSLPAAASPASDLPVSSLSKTSLKPLPPRRSLHTSFAEPWRREEDELLFNLRQQGIGWKKISPQLNRPVASCYTRYYRFLDPFLADAVEGDAAEEEIYRSAVEATQKALENNVPKSLLERSRDQSGKPFPYQVQGPWTALDRERLEQMIHQELPWSIISRELQRNQESCKEKWLRIQKARMDETRRSKKMRRDQWNRLFEQGFTPFHRDQLVLEVENHLKAKRKARIRPLGFLEEDGEDLDGDSSTFGLMSVNPGLGPNSNSMEGSASNVESIDWDEIARSLNGKFSADRLRRVYYELATTKLVWTPEEDDRLTRAVVRLGPPELQPKIWSMIKDAFGDVVRTSEDYKERWRMLDMPELEREWDFLEKKKFWRRWMELQQPGSLLSLKAFLPSESGSDPGSEVQTNEDMWDLIAEGLEYRHGRDCQLYFQQATFRFPRDPDLFQHLTHTIANVYLKPQRTHWAPESLKLMVAAVNKYLKANGLVKWNEVAKVLGGRYTAIQCESKWQYLLQRQKGKQLPQNTELDHPIEQKSNVRAQATGSEGVNEPSSSEEAIPVDAVDMIIAPRLWTDSELELLKQGVKEYGEQWAKIRDAFLPHRTIQVLHERYWRNEAKRTGRFSQKERNLLETAIETYGEDADWNLIASQVPGRTAGQCRKNWRYGHTHHVHKLDEPWTAQDRERLKAAVDRFGKKWTLVSEFVVGRTPDECRNEWREKVDNTVKSGAWSDEELNTMMERISAILTQQEAKEQALLAEQKAAQAAQDPASKSKTAFVDLAPRFKGRRKIDWDEVAKGMGGRTAQQCRLRFETHRRTFRIDADVC
ncbi:hypothetical protein EMPS_02394 [Entomortierella parvispora]|uniref:Uncharacterized protein n=1 Tax=Entomortierella parvispora TaxID=205924 RepID=A0A9P3LTW3_9FUNG|nr:hypothetical protein EMPS_02394 [Entomortierella parvispora]